MPEKGRQAKHHQPTDRRTFGMKLASNVSRSEAVGKDNLQGKNPPPCPAVCSFVSISATATDDGDFSTRRVLLKASNFY
jgi:hypothetical protein